MDTKKTAGQIATPSADPVSRSSTTPTARETAAAARRSKRMGSDSTPRRMDKKLSKGDSGNSLSPNELTKNSISLIRKFSR